MILINTYKVYLALFLARILSIIRFGYLVDLEFLLLATDFGIIG